MTVFQVLSEVISAEEFFRLVAFAEFVNVIQMLGPYIPLRRVGKLFATESTEISFVTRWGRMKGGFHS